MRMKLVHSFHISKFERRIPMGSAATKPSCAPKEFWTGCQENFPRGSKLFQKFRDYMREKEHSGEHCYKNCEAIEICIIEKRSFYASLTMFYYYFLLSDELDYF